MGDFTPEEIDVLKRVVPWFKGWETPQGCLVWGILLAGCYGGLVAWVAFFIWLAKR